MELEKEYHFSSSPESLSEDDSFSTQNSSLLNHQQYRTHYWKRAVSFTYQKHNNHILIGLSIIFYLASVSLIAATIFPGDLENRCSKQMTGWSPLLDVVGHKSMSLNANTQSIYTQAVSQETDQAWNDLWHYGPIGISDNKLTLLNKSKETDWVRHGPETPEYTGNVKAYFEGFHRIHCLHLVQQYSYKNTYNFSGQHFFDQDPQRVLNHVEHCLDNVRWGIHCNADVTPYVFEQHTDSQGHKRMLLNLQKPAKCRDVESMYQYAEDNCVGGLKGISH